MIIHIFICKCKVMILFEPIYGKHRKLATITVVRSINEHQLIDFLSFLQNSRMNFLETSRLENDTDHSFITRIHFLSLRLWERRLI